MKKLLLLTAVVTSLLLTAAGALAESIQGRAGVTGRVGFLIPADSDFGDFKIDTDAGFIGGGGIIYGYDRNIALEMDVTHSWFSGNLPSGPDRGEFSITNIAFGVQYRFIVTDPKFAPYAVGGLDILVNEYETENGAKTDVDTVVGIHVAGGLDYFLRKEIALNAEVKAVVAPNADINRAGTGGNFDPSSVAGTFGVRYFFW